MSVYLKPCPFCGFKLNADDADCIYPVNRKRTLWQVVCYETGGGCDASVVGRTPEEAVERWNHRA